MNECGYCSTEGWRNNEIQNDWLKIQVVPDGKMYLCYEAYSIDSSFELEVDINYCPMCGRKLECENLNGTKVLDIKEISRYQID